MLEIWPGDRHARVKARIKLAIYLGKLVLLGLALNAFGFTSTQSVALVMAFHFSFSLLSAPNTKTR
jgi:hypothetical protein